MAASRMQRLSLDLRIERFGYRQVFNISGHSFTETVVLFAQLSDGVHHGRGEGAGVYYLGDDIEHMLAEAERVRPAIEAGANRIDLQSLLPAGGARNALDCAFWDLEAKQQCRPVWELAGLPKPVPLASTLTIGAGEPDAMARAAREMDGKAPLKIKLTGELDLDKRRLRAVRKVRPSAWIGVDANQGYDLIGVQELIPILAELDIKVLEQPLRRGSEAELEAMERPIPFVADESALISADIESLVGRFDMVNIKLDKCGGLTEGLAMARDARQRGLGIMVGNMMGTSLSMAPSFLLGQICDVVDLDGPTFLQCDRDPGVEYRDGLIHCPAEIWGDC